MNVNTKQCVACKRIYYGYNHHCDPATINRIEAAYNADREPRAPLYGQRLQDGFEWLGDNLNSED